MAGEVRAYYSSGSIVNDVMINWLCYMSSLVDTIF
jgi:hypothetical protein